MTSEKLQKALEQLIVSFQEVYEVFNNWAEQIGSDIWTLFYQEERKFNSPKHAYHFSSKRRHTKSKFVCTYAPALKVHRNFPYQRRNY